MAICLAIQSVTVSVLLRALFVLEEKHVIRPGIIRSPVILVTVMLLLFAGNLVQISLWSYLFLALGQFEDFDTAFYFSTVNFTTLGYGDLVMTKEASPFGCLGGGKRSVDVWFVHERSLLGGQSHDGPGLAPIRPERAGVTRSG